MYLRSHFLEMTNLPSKLPSISLPATTVSPQNSILIPLFNSNSSSSSSLLCRREWWWWWKGKVMLKARLPRLLRRKEARTKRRGGQGGLNKVCGVSPELQAIVGVPVLPRIEIVRQLWAYIRKHNLQDPDNKRKIKCDEALRLVFETDCTDMFKMNKLLAKHIISMDPSNQAMRSKLSSQQWKSTDSGQSPVTISDALVKFLGTWEKEMLQSEALRHIWEYIKVHHLEDPLNSMVILCDAELQELLGCESISAEEIPNMLKRHHLLNR